MSLSLKEKLKLSVIKKEKKAILQNISNKLRIDNNSNSITFESHDYNVFLSKFIDNIEYQPVDLSVNENLLFNRFCDFLSSIDNNDLVVFQIITCNTYYYLKLHINNIKQNPILFWNIKVKNSNKTLECLLVAINNSFGFSILPTENFYELRIWNSNNYAIENRKYLK
ncbi:MULTISPECIES: hypothetical protein [Pseudomonadota]|uniref:Uncharacterized protein n=3 Tax=Pseudomonadota TaxID=1224 RepID=X2H3Q3_9GAMM|nr:MULTISPECIES: hypothetical protein [Pseudomonadota]KES12143.1 Protein of unknown function (DUF3244) [Snodgrassella alvi SCGC AB-598-O11]AHN25697.1 hypothetical protein GAPWK_1120 [Gilliamella apicola]MBI0159825.1 hypothetical protein [Snodgrassella sp. W6238H11]MBI0161998.1 hypothetical protein [Snodgrassella sp. W6238H14]OTP80950.1 hypothetical protein B5S40_14035 [Gilliamella apicola]